MPTIKHPYNMTDEQMELFQRASYAGVNSKTANKEKLAEAEKLLGSGADSETVRKQTGWFKGPDKKWRYEIDDSKAKLGTNGLDHPELLKAYPQLKDIRHKIYRGEQGDLGYTKKDAEGNTEIGISNRLGGEEKLKTLLHEYQHAVQNEEQFAKGGSPEGTYYDRLIALKKIFEYEDKHFTPQEKLILPKLTEKIPLKEYNQVRLLEAIAEAKKLARESMPEQEMEYERLRAEYEAETLPNSPDEAFARYKNLFGEIEARDVSNRKDFTPEQRLNTPPYSSEDTTQKRIKFAEGGMVAGQHRQYEDNYTNALKQLGITDMYAFEDENGGVYYGTQPKSFQPASGTGDVPTEKTSKVDQQLTAALNPQSTSGSGSTDAGGNGASPAGENATSSETGSFDSIQSYVDDPQGLNAAISQVSEIAKGLSLTSQVAHALGIVGDDTGEDIGLDNTNPSDFGNDPGIGDPSSGVGIGDPAGDPGGPGGDGGAADGSSAGGAADGGVGGSPYAQGGMVAPKPTDPPVQPGQNPGTADNIQAKLSQGEFVVPANIVRHYGEKFFYDLMEKAKKAQGPQMNMTAGQPQQKQGLLQPRPQPGAPAPQPNGLLNKPNIVGRPPLA